MEARLLLLPQARPGFTSWAPATALPRNVRGLKNIQCTCSLPWNFAFPRALPILQAGSRGSCLEGFGDIELVMSRALANESAEVHGAGEGPTVATVRGVLFDMDGVLCNSEAPSRDAAVALFAGMGVNVNAVDFVPFMGTGEANFLGGVAKLYGLENFDIVAAKEKFFEIYIEKYAKPNSGLGFPGALELVLQCKKAGLKLAVASSADRVKVNANLAAAGLSQENFDAIVSADLFEKLKPAPDIFLAAAKALGLPPAECVVIEDALAGVQAAQAAGMRCIAVTTTLDGERLQQGGALLIRKDISNISLEDILTLK